MALSETQLARLRRMVGEAHKDDDDRMLADEDLALLAEDVGRMVDAEGNGPEDEGYTPTYDLNRIAAEAWREKAGIVAESFDFIADGGEFKRSQVYEHYLSQATRYAGRVASLTTDTA